MLHFAISLIYVLLLYFLFKVNRFKHGFSFLQDSRYRSVGFYIVGVVLTIYTFMVILSSASDVKAEMTIFASVLVCSSGVWLWVKSAFSRRYKESMANREVSGLQEEIDKLKEEKKKVVEENFALSKVLHEYNHKISALQNTVNTFYSKLQQEDFSTESAKEIAQLVQTINASSNEYLKNVERKIPNAKEKLPTTNVDLIDNMFTFQQSEALKKGIEFVLTVTGSVNYMIDNVIDKNKLETLIADHLKDAIIAITHSKNNLRSIICNIGIVDNCYEFSVTDSGIPFEPETLIKLGEEAVTTHKETGGTGIGFMTTFEMMKETKASLIITELTNEPESFTKTVTIRFDGLNEYKIQSHRSALLTALKGEKEIKVEKLK